MKNIDTSDWVNFRVGHLFRVFNGKKYVMKNRLPGDIPLVSTSALNNGISDHVSFPPGSNYETHSDILTVAYSGSVGATFYHPNEVFVGETVMGLELLDKTVSLSDGCGLFIAAVIEKIVKQFTYVNKVKVLQMQNEISIPLPVTAQGAPDWKFMEHYIKDLLQHQEIQLERVVSLSTLQPRTVDIETWKDFRIDELFNVVKGSRLRSTDRTPGDIPYVGASQFNNGITHYIGNDEHVHPGGVLTVCYNGPVGTTFYQPNDFWATDDVNVLYPLNKVSPETLLFLAPIIERVGSNYAYIDKWKLEDMRAANIKLPVDGTGAPDWAYMESATKTLLKQKAADLDVLQKLLPQPEESEVV
ncbi:Restriction enzyme BgcI subunit beta [Corynebacterium diphtheriae]|nr:Restriction enzyme BgcI subunit beta [Corynebacterium diphtheriae]